MRKLIIGGFCLVLAANSAQAADLREPYDPGFSGPPPRAYLPPPEPDDEPTLPRPAPRPLYGYREVPPLEYRERPRVHREDLPPPAWREARPRQELLDDPRWDEPRWHRHHHHHDDDCRVRPTPWGPERICR